MGMQTNLQHSIDLLSGMDEELEIPKVSQDNFLTRDQVEAVSQLVTFVKYYIKASENPDSVFGLESLALTLDKVLDPIRLSDGKLNAEILKRPLKVIDHNSGSLLYTYASMVVDNKLQGEVLCILCN